MHKHVFDSSIFPVDPMNIFSFWTFKHSLKSSKAQIWKPLKPLFAFINLLLTCFSSPPCTASPELCLFLQARSKTLAPLPPPDCTKCHTILLIYTCNHVSYIPHQVAMDRHACPGVPDGGLFCENISMVPVYETLGRKCGDFKEVEEGVGGWEGGVVGVVVRCGWGCAWMVWLGMRD